MMQKKVSSKTAGAAGDAQKKARDLDMRKCQKEEVKLPALPSPSANKKAKDVPMLSKATAVPNGGSTPVKSTTPKPPTKRAARSTTTKLSKCQPPQPAASPSTTERQTSEGEDLNVSVVLAIEEKSALPTGSPPSSTEEGRQLDSTEGPLAAVVEPSPDAIATAEAAAAAEEAELLRKLNGNGMVKLIYENYDELFPIEEGSTTQANIDDVYCLSFVMPNCLVRLSRHPNPERFRREESGIFDSLVREDPRGTYHDLEKDQAYYVVVEQEADQLRRDQEAATALWSGELQKQKEDGKDDGRGFESCSCIYGNPCVDEYGCRDWHSRFAVATKNGWKGF